MHYAGPRLARRILAIAAPQFFWRWKEDEKRRFVAIAGEERHIVLYRFQGRKLSCYHSQRYQECAQGGGPDALSKANEPQALSQCLRLMPASYQLRIGAVMKSSRCIHAAAQFVCQHWYPAKGGCLVQFVFVDFIDAFLGPLSPQKAFTGACRAGALESTLEYLLSCATPIWKEALHATAQGGHLYVLRWMGDRPDRRGPWRSDFDNLLGVAASHGYLELVKWLFERGLDLNTTRKLSKSTRGYYAKAWSCRHDLCEGLQLAAGNGHLAVVQWLHSVRREVFAGGPMESIMDYAVAGGHLAVAQWLFENGDTCSTNAANNAAEEGHLEILQWLHKKRICYCTSRAVDNAAEKGHLPVLKWLQNTVVGGCRSAKLYLPIQNGHFEVAQWLHANVPSDVHREMGDSSAFAARYGYLEILKWLHQEYPHIFSGHEMNVAATNGHLNVIKWLHDNRSEACTCLAPWRAARIGHLEMVQWLHEHYPDRFRSDVMNAAAEKGHLDVVQWLHENRSEGCTGQAMEVAAYRGHLKVVLWLLTHRTEGVPSSAIEIRRNFEVLDLFRHQFSTTSLTKDPFEGSELRGLYYAYRLDPAFVRGCLRCLAEVAVEQGHIPILEWLNQFEIKLQTTAPIRRAVSRGDLNVVKWLHQNYGTLFEQDLLQLAVQNGHLDVTRWLREHGYELSGPQLVLQASENGNMSLLRWLLDNGATIDLSTATKVTMNPDYMEVMWWVSESVRVQLVLEAIRNESHRLVWWLLMRTRFEEKLSQSAISGAVDEAHASMKAWVLEHIEDDVCRWCFPRKRVATTSDDNALAKRAREK